ncbi:hypothetical protein J2W22_002792 [Sphingomonas kyeonggiensis]|uniref:hypothetical protein n=1 Tax=Sphingomonas kyeonggiensis TaxID=1268553 RepID=UPI00278B705C|nr:hypothetical protein [Sphingomonas kyeonggiensis]MDQ0250728.1 hypothetical protein [Sphingomonas kyeonggiensis]
MSADATATPFTLRTVLVLVVMGVIGFLAFLLLTAYGEDLQPEQRPGNHALATSAVGFAGAADLVRRVHGSVKMVRRDADLDTPDPLVITLEPTTDPDTIEKLLKRRAALPTILVLPKWLTMPRRDKPAWVMSFGSIPVSELSRQIAKVTKAKVSANGDGLRTIAGDDLEAVVVDLGDEEEEDLQRILTDANGNMLVARVKEKPLLIVADPDLLDNQGLKTLAGAERAMQLLGAFGEGHVAFDLTLHGFGQNPNLLKLAFEAPFLPLTLCLLIAALLAGWHAMLRFGPALPELRGVAFGKRAIAENGAALLRLAGRRHRTGDRYAALIRDTAASATGAPSNLPPEALDRYLDRLDKTGEPFTALAERAGHAQDTRALLDAARALYQWKRTVTREH